MADLFKINFYRTTHVNNLTIKNAFWLHFNGMMTQLIVFLHVILRLSCMFVSCILCILYDSRILMYFVYLLLPLV